MVSFSESTYLKWVQRSINFYFAECRVAVNGRISHEYRSGVSDVQVTERVTETGDVGVREQQILVISNHDSLAYSAWVQKQLNKTMGSKLNSILIDSTIQKVIREFQRKHKKRYSGGLRVDGWFGYKTELVMIDITGEQPPSRCIEKPAKPVVGKKKCLVRDLPGLRGLKSGNTLANCLIKKILETHTITDFLDLHEANVVVSAPAGTKDEFDAFVDLRQQFKDMIARRKRIGSMPSCRDAVQFFVHKAEQMLSGINGLLHADPNIPVVRQLRKRVHELSKKPLSLYRCPTAKQAVDNMIDKVGYSGTVDS